MSYEINKALSGCGKSLKQNKIFIKKFIFPSISQHITT